MHEVRLLQVPLLFGRAHPHITLTENGAVATRNHGGAYRSAASTVVMRSGHHFAQFTVLRGVDMMFGVIRPGWDVEGVVNAAVHTDGHCFYDTYSGLRFPGNKHWEGSQPAKGQRDRIGMLLDLDQGIMTVWKNGVRLEVMVAEGLSGPLCWAVSMYNGTGARIESAPALASPTEEELAAANAWQAARLYG